MLPINIFTILISTQLASRTHLGSEVGEFTPYPVSLCGVGKSLPSLGLILPSKQEL